MVSVRINGVESGISCGGLSRFPELVELVKANIDPEHMITSIVIDGRLPTEEDWSANLSQFETNIVEIETGKPAEYFLGQIGQAADVVQACFTQFRSSRKSFQSGEMVEGNKLLIEAVGTAKAFFDWYGTLLQLVTPEEGKVYDIEAHVTDISECCKRICQQQLYQSWWALGETLEKELEPKLDKLETFFRGLK